MVEKNEEAAEIVSKSIEDFTADLHKKVASDTKENFVFSALSCHLILSMVAYGARGSTAEEIRQVLHLPENDTQAFHGFRNLIDALNNTENAIVKLVNKIYTSNYISVSEKFKEITRNFFHSQNASLDVLKPNDSANEINQWCCENTNGKIVDILTPDDITRDTTMILLNAVYFKADWFDKFNKRGTEPRPFHINKTTTVNVPTMFIKETFMIKDLPEQDAECIALPYENEDLFMVIIIPNKVDGLKVIEENLEKISLDYIRATSYECKLRFYLPKFKIETTIDLEVYLKKMGLIKGFSSKANFEGIAHEPMKIDKVIQKAFIIVNEEGTEVAVTFRSMLRRCKYTPPPREFKVDRPFFYKIIFDGITLFSGHVVNPLG